MERAALRQLLGDALEAGLDALADGLAAATAPGGPVRMVAPGDLLIDPRRFQFRQSVVNLSGTDGRLRDACRWNQALAGVLLVWPDPGGRLALVDGHRLALAHGRQRRPGNRWRPAVIRREAERPAVQQLRPLRPLVRGRRPPAPPEARPRPSRCPNVPRSAQITCNAWGVPPMARLKRWRSGSG